jgi:uncharacterized protein (TIGR04255 family)
MKTKYKNPPINELVIGLYFDRDMPFRSEHVGLFWSSVRDEFPTIRQQPTVPPVFGTPNVLTFEITGENEIYPMPRFWLEAGDGTTLMQLQKNAFLFNWRKRDAAYPHYEMVKAAFDKNFSRFGRFLEKEIGAPQPNLQIAELTYINFIESGEYWRGPQDTGKIFPNFRVAVPENAEVAPPDFNQVTVQRFAPDLGLTTSIRNGRSAQVPNKMVLIFEFRALGLLGGASKGEADSWFERAHETIGNCFTAMTNPDIQQRYWQQV